MGGHAQLFGVDPANGTDQIPIAANPTTGAIKVEDSAGGAGTPDTWIPTRATVTTTPAQILAVRASRSFAIVKNLGSATVYLGADGASAATTVGAPVEPGEALSLPTSAAIFASVAAGTEEVSISEGWTA